jgi:hypothetical protein
MAPGLSASPDGLQGSIFDRDHPEVDTLFVVVPWQFLPCVIR